MAKSFIYPVATATITDGTRGESVNGDVEYTFHSSDAVTNEHRISDDSIGSAISGFESDDVLRFDLGASYACDVIAVYMLSSDGTNMELYYGSSSTAMGYDTTMPITTTPTMSAEFTAGWTVRTFTEATKQYWFVRAAGDINPAEIIIGKKYDFDVNPELNNKIGEEFGTDIMTSYGGQEYANKRHAPKTTWSWNWAYLSSSQKTSLEGLNSSVQDHKKFIYDDETTKHYVRMTKPLEFTEVAPSVYSTSMTLREQLA